MLSSAGQPSFTLGISRPTVWRFLAAEQFPERLSGRKRPRQSIVAPYLPFLRERWQAGCHNGRQLFREAKARGYRSTRNLKAIIYLIAGKLELALPT